MLRTDTYQVCKNLFSETILYKQQWHRNRG